MTAWYYASHLLAFSKRPLGRTGKRRHLDSIIGSESRPTISVDLIRDGIFAMGRHIIG
jgi:hypothetical protein